MEWWQQTKDVTDFKHLVYEIEKKEVVHWIVADNISLCVNSDTSYLKTSQDNVTYTGNLSDPL